MGEDVLTLRYVPLSQCVQWDRNPKLHDIGALIASFEKHGFKSALKYEPQLNGGQGGIGAGNGRAEALRAMRDGGKGTPRGIVIDAQGEWCVPVLFGVDAPSQAAAESFGMDDNMLTLSGGNFDLSDMMRLFDNTATDLLRELADAGEVTVGVDAEDLGRLLDVAQEYRDLDAESEGLAGFEEVTINVVVPAKHETVVKEWLANGEVQTGPGMGKGVMRRCGLL